MLKIYNTLGRELQEFKPIKKGKITFYQCGPTVYSHQHIGNMRSAVMGDLIRRSLMYLGYKVDFVKNYTDVGHLVSDEDEGEDKIDKGAKKEGLTPKQVTDKYIKQYEEDITSLNILQPDHKPRATEYVQQMIEMVQDLLDKGYAYLTPTAIFFDVTKFPDYTKLSGQKLDMNKQGEGHGSIEDQNKKNPFDFAVWFFRTGAHKNALQYWPSPFESPEVENGEGFPGWHIECSAMSKDLLGETIDIHMGGVEHIPVHHPNEIAQSEAANGKKFVHYWIHHEHLDIDSTKMSKSLGNIYTIDDLKDKGYQPLSLRYFFLQAQYRSKQNFTFEALDAATTARTKLMERVSEWSRMVKDIRDPNIKVDEGFKKKFIEALEDDFNIPLALSIAWEMAKSDLSADVKLTTILDFDKVLGLNFEDIPENPREIDIPVEAQILIDERRIARLKKDWKKSDDLRDQIRKLYNLDVIDRPEGEEVRRLQ